MSESHVRCLDNRIQTGKMLTDFKHWQLEIYVDLWVFVYESITSKYWYIDIRNSVKVIFPTFSVDMTQDLASKGLGQVMEVCSPDVKDSLVSELVETLMTGKRWAD